MGAARGVGPQKKVGTKMGWQESIVTFINEKFTPTTTSCIRPDAYIMSEREIADDIHVEKFLPTGITLHATLRGHKSTIQRMSWSPDGKRMATPDDNGEVRIWDVSSGLCEFVLIGHRERVRETAFSSNGKKLITHSEDEKIIVWDVETGDCVGFLSTRAHGFGYNTKTDHYIYTIGPYNDLHEINIRILNTPSVLRKVNTSGWPLHLAFSLDGKRIVFRESDESVCIMPLESREKGVRSLSCKHALDFVFSPDGNVLALAGMDEHKVWLWNINGESPRTLDNEIGPMRLDFSNSGRLLAVLCYDGIMRIWDTRHDKIIAKLLWCSQYETGSIRFHPNLPRLAVVSHDISGRESQENCIVRVYDINI